MGTAHVRIRAAAERVPEPSETTAEITAIPATLCFAGRPERTSTVRVARAVFMVDAISDGWRLQQGVVPTGTKIAGSAGSSRAADPGFELGVV